MGAGAIPINIEKAFRARAKSRHKLHVFTADTDYAGEDCIDVSIHGGHFILVPPKHLIIDYKSGKINEKEFQKECFEFLENSFIQYQHTWDNILNMKRIVLVCSCNTDDKTCHRYFIIKFLNKFGAIYKGKIK